MDRTETMQKFKMTGTIYDDFFIDYMEYYGGSGRGIVKWEPYDKLMICIYYDNGNKAYYDAVGNTVKNIGRRQDDAEFIDDELFMKRFAWRLGSAINSTGLSRTEICERTGISKASLSGYLSGRTVPNMLFIHKLAKVLNCPVEELVNAGDLDL